VRTRVVEMWSPHSRKSDDMGPTPVVIDGCREEALIALLMQRGADAALNRTLVPNLSYDISAF